MGGTRSRPRLLPRKHGTYSHRMDRDWVFFDIDHDSYYSHHTRVEALPGMPAMLGVSRRGSVVRVNADGNSVDHDLEAALWHATTVPLPSGQRRVSEGETFVLLCVGAAMQALEHFARRAAPGGGP